MQQLPIFCAFLCLAGAAGASSINYDQSSAKVSATLTEVSNLSARSNSRQESLTAPRAQLVHRKDGLTPSTAYLPLGGTLTGNFGSLKLGRGEVWLHDLSWSGDQGESIEIISSKAVKSSSGSYSCRVNKVVVKDQYGVEVNTGYTSITIELYPGYSVQITCTSGRMVVTTVEEQ